MSDSENVVPEQEINRRRRVAELAHEIGDMANEALIEIRDLHADATERMNELDQIGVSVADFLPMVLDHAPPGIRNWLLHNLGKEMFDSAFEMLEHNLKIPAAKIDKFWEEMMGLDPEHDSRHTKMVKLVDRLLESAPKMEGAAADDAGAFECQIILKNGFRAVGALCKTKEGLLRFGSVAREDPQAALAEARQPRVLMAEHYFDYEDLQAIVIPRPMVEEQKSRIVTGMT